MLVLSLPFVSTLSLTTMKPSLLNSAGQPLSSQTSSNGGASSITSAVSSATGGTSFASSLLYSMLGGAPSRVANPYPYRTMVGNLYFKLRQHSTPIMVIPPLLRLMYRFREPIMGGLNSVISKVPMALGSTGALGALAGAAAAGEPSASASDVEPSVVSPNGETASGANAVPAFGPFGAGAGGAAATAPGGAFSTSGGFGPGFGAPGFNPGLMFPGSLNGQYGGHGGHGGAHGYMNLSPFSPFQPHTFG